jgi:hypothetical protein
VIDEDSYDPAEEVWPGSAVAPPAPQPAPEPEPEPVSAPEPVVEPPPAPVPEKVAEAEPVVKPAAVEETVPEAEPAPPEVVAEASEPAAEMVADAPEPKVTRFGAPARPAAEQIQQAATGSDQGFTDFSHLKPSAPAADQAALATPGPDSDLIDVLPRLLPAFNDLSSAVDRPFGAMPEVMPPPPLRPILPPELQEEPAKPGLLSRILGRGK